MGMGNKKIIQRQARLAISALQGVFNIFDRLVGAMSHTAVKQGGIFISNKQITFACFMRYAINVPFHICNNT
jgi:hypothetical protein